MFANIQKKIKANAKLWWEKSTKGASHHVGPLLPETSKTERKSTSAKSGVSSSSGKTGK